MAALPAALRATWARWNLRRRDVAALVVASRGVWGKAERRALAGRLAPWGRRIRVLADVEAAYLGALGNRPGVLLLAGTGSIALGRDACGRFHRAGGLGPLLGDEGSAFWIGREWLRYRAGAPPGVAYARPAGRGLDATRRLALHHAAPSKIAALAPAILQRASLGDPVARAIVGRAQEELAALLAAVARALSRSGTVTPRRRRSRLPVSWAGTLLARPSFRAGVWRAARRAGIGFVAEPPRGSALDAALDLAEREARRPRRRA